MEKRIVKEEELNNVTGGVTQSTETARSRTYYRCSLCFSGQYINADYDGELPPKCPNCHEPMEKANAGSK